MSMLTITVLGQGEAIGAFRKLDLAMQRRAKDVINEAALNIMTTARKACPVDSNRLRSSITPRFYSDGLAADIGPTGGGAEIKYAQAVEFGSRPHFPPPDALKGWAKRHGMEGKEFLIARAISKHGTKAQPFLFPAWENERPKYLQAMREALGLLGGDV